MGNSIELLKMKCNKLKTCLLCQVVGVLRVHQLLFVYPMRLGPVRHLRARRWSSGVRSNATVLPCLFHVSHPPAQTAHRLTIYPPGSSDLGTCCRMRWSLLYQQDPLHTYW